MSIKLLGIHAKARSGKDTVANYLAEHHGFVKYSFADPLKATCAVMFGIAIADFYDDEKKDVPNEFWDISPRVMAQKLGTEGGRKLFFEDIWIKRAALFVDYMDKPVVIPDVRFENEADFIRSRGGVVLHLSRPGVEAVEAHESENGIAFKNGYDLELKNNGTINDLYKLIDIEMEMYS